MKHSEPAAFRITIDDLGMYKGVESGAIELATHGIPIYCSWLTNYSAPSAQYLATKNCKPGLHFNVIEGPSALRSPELCDQAGNFSLRWPQFIFPHKKLRLAVEEEFECQIQKVWDWFGQPTHVDSHLHIHSIPWIHSLLLTKQKHYGFAYLRNPFQPLHDDYSAFARPGILAKLALLRFFGVLNQSTQSPCYGISHLFAMQHRQILANTAGKSREIIWHAGKAEGDLPWKQFRFMDEHQIQLRQKEWEELEKFVRTLALNSRDSGLREIP
jgi:predicted glycoside hydrolase/deacetylase ChbG (UPF0249 family)